MQIKFTIVLLSVLMLGVLSGCKEYRNTPKLQAEDMEICRKAEMKAYLTMYNEIGCSPTAEEYQNFQ